MNPDGPITLEELEAELRAMRTEMYHKAKERERPFWRDRYLEQAKAADNALIQLGYAAERIESRRREKQASESQEE